MSRICSCGDSMITQDTLIDDPPRTGKLNDRVICVGDIYYKAMGIDI